MSRYVCADPGVLGVLAAMLVTMTVGTMIRFWNLRGAAADKSSQRFSSLQSWWIVALAVVAATLFGPPLAAVLFTAVGVLALREFLRITDSGLSLAERLTAYALIVVNYLLIWLQWWDMFRVFLPLASVGSLGVMLLCRQRTGGYSRDVAGVVWGLLVTAYLPSHAVLAFSLPVSDDSTCGAGWFLLLLLLTEGSDIAQALVGRAVGRRKIAPVVSPNKTWEGFFGGVGCAILLGLLIGPVLTDLGPGRSALAGLLLAVVGLFGDLNISALKRDAGVKDSGTWLPGQGGILDRIDSLTFTAPFFYYFVKFLPS